jgi:thiol-disulfide isomerase/thioredoxin
MSSVSSLPWRQIRVLVVPGLVLFAALGLLVVDGLRMRSKQLSRYELPGDSSAPAMLEFMRKMTGSVEQSQSVFESSNTKSIYQAIQKSFERLQLDRLSLTEAEQHEADYYQLRFLGIAIFQGLLPDATTETKKFLKASRQFLSDSKKFTSREQQIAQLSIQLLDSLGRVEEERELLTWILAQIDQRAEFSSDVALATAQSLRKIARRLEMMNELLVLQSKTIDGKPFDIESLRGKIVLIEFWGTHCKPCIADFPALKRIYAANKERGFEIVSICLHAAPARIQSFAAQHQLPWIQLCDDKSASEECNQALAERFGIQAVPTTLLLDTDGRVVAMALRPLSGDLELDLEIWLRKLLRMPLKRS